MSDTSSVTASGNLIWLLGIYMWNGAAVIHAISLGCIYSYGPEVN